MKNNNPHPQTSNKNKTIITIVVISIITLSALVYFLLTNKKYKNDTVTKQSDSSVIKKDSIYNGKTDSIALSKMENLNEEGDEGEYYGDYVYVGNELVLGETKLKYGDPVFIDYQKSIGDKMMVYLQNPYNFPNTIAYSIKNNNLLERSTFENYNKNFSLLPFSNLPYTIKDIILENNYSNGNDYKITQNAERAKSSICYGDFDGDNIKDYAILLDNNEKQISRLLVICNNSETRKPYIGFAENYSDKMRINSFKKGASIIINSELQPSPLDGIILKGEDVKIAIIYDKELQKFKTLYQE